MSFVMNHVLAFQTYSLIPGFVTSSNIQTATGVLPSARIIDENNAEAFSIIPTMGGRDGVDMRVFTTDGVEFIELNSGDRVYMDAAHAKQFSELGDRVTITNDAIWVDIDLEHAGQSVQITAPTDGSWFIYDYRMNAISTSLERYPRDTIILPHDGRMVFVGEPGVTFSLQLLR